MGKVHNNVKVEMKRKMLEKVSGLKESVVSKIRFSEVDSMAIVWHGNYIHFFEDAREAFGEKYGIGYMDMYNSGYVAPLVSIHCDYKQQLRYGERVRTEITWVDTPAAKLIFRYELYNDQTNTLVATGESTQVFLSVKDQQLCLNLPPFFEEWKQKYVQSSDDV